MGAYSTVTLSRSDAISRITERLEQATNEELSGALFALTCDRELDNYTVLNDSDYIQYQQQNPDDRY